MPDDPLVIEARKLRQQIEKLAIPEMSEFAQVVEKLAVQGDRLYHRRLVTPRAVRPKKRGRRLDPDGLALVEMALLLERDSDLKRKTAAKEIARGINDGNREDSSIARRLVTKYNKDTPKYRELMPELEILKRLAGRRPEFKPMLRPWFSSRVDPSTDMEFLCSLTDEQVADFFRRAGAEDAWALVCEMHDEIIREREKM
jgi:hypothetical protein